ncbi:MAG: trimethylamine methyltransferase family protein [Syntrophaceae bacterium]|nr:trimethylamine methyltransferase family protein [Syntrophaceae bacterium]
MRKQPSLLKVITDQEVELIHDCSLNILNQIGVYLPHDAILDSLNSLGASVQFDKKIVRFPPELVQKALTALPKDFSVKPADAGPTIHFGDGELKLSFDQTPFIVDYMSGTKSRKNTDEIYKGIAVSNALENVRLAGGFCLPQDIPDKAGDVKSFELLWSYSNKPAASWIYSAQAAQVILKMAEVVADGAENVKKRKLVTYFAEPISPLRWSPHTLHIMTLLAEYECPIYLGPMVTAGGSGPCTLAGTLALHNAEILQGLVVIYALNPHQPVIYSSHAHRLDMHRGTILYGSPEQALLAVGATQLAHKYGLIISGNVMLTDSNTPDYMAGFEAGATAAYALAAGWEMLGFCGFGTIGVCGSGVGLSLEHAIIQDEALSYLKRMISSFSVNEDTLAFEVIKDVGIGGVFIDREHTARHVRSELWQDGGIFKAVHFDEWQKCGRPTALDHANDKLKIILQDALPLEPVLPDDKVKELKAMSDNYLASMA